VRCPYCRERVELVVDPDTVGQYVEDCAVCCRPWAVSVSEEAGERQVEIQPAQ
jgi:Cysteine-rich CPXCG